MFACVQEMRTTATTDRVSEELLSVIAYVMKSAQPAMLDVAAGLDLSFSQLRGLHVLAAADHDLALHELAERVGLSVAATGRAVDGLVHAGLLSRREDGHDRRVKRLAVTEPGTQALMRLGAARREAVGRLVESLDDDQRTALSDALRPVLDRPEVDALRRGMCR